MKGTLASAIQATYGARKAADFGREVADALKSAMRMTVDTEIMRHINGKRVTSSDWKTYATEILATVRLPFPTTWIEWNPEPFLNEDVSSGEGTCIIRIGYLLYQEDGCIKMCEAAANRAGVCRVSPAIFAIWDDCGGIKYIGDQVADQDLERVMTIGFAVAILIVQILTARNTPLIVGPGDDYIKLNRQRAKAGKPPLLGTRPVRWDMSRTERRIGRNLSTGERSTAIAHMCRGHIKVRKSGSFWWSGHFRNTRGGDAPVGGRDHEVFDDMKLAA